LFAARSASIVDPETATLEELERACTQLLQFCHDFDRVLEAAETLDGHDGSAWPPRSILTEELLGELFPADYEPRLPIPAYLDWQTRIPCPIDEELTEYWRAQRGEPSSQSVIPMPTSAPARQRLAAAIAFRALGRARQ
jgi:hypothetical protein